MATKNLVPRATGEGSLGTASKKWGNIYADYITLADGETLQTKIANQNTRITTAEGTVNTLSGDVTTLYGNVDDLSSSKADKSTTYTKTEADTLYDGKLDKSGGTVTGNLACQGIFVVKNTGVEYNVTPSSNQYPKPLSITDKNDNMAGFVQYGASTNGARSLSLQVRGQDGDYSNITVQRRTDGTDNFIAGNKEIERVNSSGTTFIRYESGLQICFEQKNSQSTRVVTFPKSFSSVPVVLLCSRTASAMLLGTANSATVTGFSVTADNAYYYYVAIGYWK